MDAKDDPVEGSQLEGGSNPAASDSAGGGDDAGGDAGAPLSADPSGAALAVDTSDSPAAAATASADSAATASTPPAAAAAMAALTPLPNASASPTAGAGAMTTAIAVDPAYESGAAGAAPATAAANNTFSKMIAIAMTAQGSFTFKIAVLIIVLTVLCLSVYLNYYEIHIYNSLFEENKMCERPLGTWLYVSGISGFVGLSLSTAGSITVVIAKRTRSEFKIKSGVALHCLNQLNNLFGFIWMIYGSALVYGMDPVNRMCPDTTYNFTWYFVTATWAVTGTVVVLALIAAIGTLIYRRVQGIGTTSYEFDDRITA